LGGKPKLQIGAEALSGVAGPRMEIPARQHPVRAPAIGADQRAVIDVRGQAAGRFVTSRLCRARIELGLWSG